MALVWPHVSHEQSDMELAKEAKGQRQKSVTGLETIIPSFTNPRPPSRSKSPQQKRAAHA